MNNGPVISNSSPLIGLEQIGQLALLARLYGEVFVPPAVIRETALSVPRHSWLSERRLMQPLTPPIAMADIGDGEREAIGLALELGAQWVILDDEQARRLALSLDLPVIGTLGVLLSAKDEGLLTAIRPYVEDLIAVRFYAAPSLVDNVLLSADEAPLSR
jgi:predicted nucleic acid-binding protein